MYDEKLKVIELFAGVGGIRLGFDKAFGSEVETVFVSEHDKHPVKTYVNNFATPAEPINNATVVAMHTGAPFIYGDITKISEKDIPEFDICLAGFPCQAFSFNGKQLGFSDNYKGMTRGTLFREVVRICDFHKPKVIFCENVEGLVKHDYGKTFPIIKGAFEEIGYKVFYQVLDSQDYGVAQRRKRIYIVCFRKDIAPDDFLFPEPIAYDDKNKKPVLRNVLDPAPIPSRYYLSDVYLNWLREHRKRHSSRGNGFGYVVRSLDDISGTVTCTSSGKECNMICDPRKHSMIPTTNIKGKINTENLRFLTPNEFKKLQGFPDDFELVGSDTQKYRQMGNAVSVPVVAAVAREIRKHLLTPD